MITFQLSKFLTNQVGAHEGHGQLVVVLVVNGPDGPLVEVDVLPEPGHGSLGVLVGVLALPVVNGEGRATKSLKRMLGLGGSGGLSLLSSGLGSLLLGGGLLLGRSLLLGGNVLDGLVNELLLVRDSGPDGLVDNSLEPAGGGGVLGPPLLVEEVLEAAADHAGGEDVGKSEPLADEVGVDGQVLLEDLDGLEGSSLALLNSLLVVRGTADEGEEPASKLGEDLGVGKGHPAEDGGVVLLGLAEEGGLLVLGGDCVRVSRCSDMAGMCEGFLSKQFVTKDIRVNILNSDFQTGITVLIGFLIFGKGSSVPSANDILRTVDGNGNALGEVVAISTDKGGDLAQLVDLQVVGRDASGGVGLDNLNVEAILLGDSDDGLGARLAL